MKPTYANIRDIVLGVGAEIGISIRQQDVLASTDPDSRQIANFVVETMEELLTRYPFRVDLGTNPPVIAEDGSAKTTPTADEDVILIDARLLKLGAKWRFLKSKGFTYEEEFRGYETRISAFAYNRSKGVKVDLNVSAASQV